MYQIRAEGVANPYKLIPYLTAKVAAGTNYSPPISIFNPHSTVLHVKEVPSPA